MDGYDWGRLDKFANRKVIYHDAANNDVSSLDFMTPIKSSTHQRIEYKLVILVGMLHQNRKQCIESIRQELNVNEHIQKHISSSKSTHYDKPYD